MALRQWRVTHGPYGNAPARACLCSMLSYDRAAAIYGCAWFGCNVCKQFCLVGSAAVVASMGLTACLHCTACALVPEHIPYLQSLLDRSLTG